MLVGPAQNLAVTMAKLLTKLLEEAEQGCVLIHTTGAGCRAGLLGRGGTRLAACVEDWKEEVRWELWSRLWQSGAL
jgi:hypothetical protein